MKRNPAGLLLVLSCSIFIFGCAANMTANKKTAQAREQLGNSLVREGDYQGGLKELLEAARLDPESESIQNAIGYTYQGLRDFDKAIQHYKKALELKSDYPEAQNNLGTVYGQLGRWEEAIALFQKAADNDFYRTRHFAYDNLGSIYRTRGDYRLAIKNYKKAVVFSPAYSPAYANMALAHEMLQEWDLAVEAHKKAIDISPELAVFHLNLGRLYLRLKRAQEAAEEFLATISLDRTGPYGEEAKKLLREVRKTE
ncbi:MAG: tetratricopeptide repeat protein [Proteobacteria bacterium]|nr:tetratricopeptide repeat protein [Pseudomonadota bacterium]